MRARSYSKKARQRAKAQVGSIMQEVQGLHFFCELVEAAPHIVLVLSEDLNCRILYANAAIARVLHMHVASVFGRCVPLSANEWK